ncbi:hypothetical protein BESB_031420 [Besnoitia besnoiti]|uniref:CRAL-TRIO domain-containing protein n=1 Tax=Besnoitia besnoiti TaxID=94643 RepID=A0A2A9LXR2_BESBE|nr:hypothetical protein BESB_031420 [Besnoitia besnoiti]PFH31268.1 hypothetical protein BESB_031420 [Besnoitia besnoiti]
MTPPPGCSPASPEASKARQTPRTRPQSLSATPDGNAQGGAGLLRFSVEDLRNVESGFERHQSLYSTFLHGRSRQNSLVIYRKIAAAAADETYAVPGSLSIDGFLLQQALLQASSSTPRVRFLLVIDLEEINPFIKTALNPVAVANLHRQPHSAPLAFANSPYWQTLRRLFFVPARCEGVILLNAPSIVLQLLSVFDHFLFHPNRSLATGYGNPASARAIQSALAHNKGGRFLLQGSLDTSALCEVVDSAQVPAEYSCPPAAGAAAASAGAKRLGETTEALYFFQALFELVKRLDGGVQKAKSRNPMLFDFSVKATAAGIKASLCSGLGADANGSASAVCPLPGDSDAVAPAGAAKEETQSGEGGAKKASDGKRQRSRRSPRSSKTGSSENTGQGNTDGGKRSGKKAQPGDQQKDARRSTSEYGAGAASAGQKGSTEGTVNAADANAGFSASLGSADGLAGSWGASGFGGQDGLGAFGAQFGDAGAGGQLIWGAGADDAGGVGGGWGGEATSKVPVDRGFFMSESEALEVGHEFDDLD